MADVAFLAMDLAFHGHGDLAGPSPTPTSRPADDAEGRTLLPFYIAYRAMVRGKVESFELEEKEVPEGQRWQDLQRARAHFLLALGALAPPAGAALPGAGRGSAGERQERAAPRAWPSEAGFDHVRSDEVRKRLAGIAPDESAAAPLDQGLYTPEWRERVYAVCLEHAEEALFEGRRVVVDATFQEESKRRAFLDAARAWGVPVRCS